MLGFTALAYLDARRLRVSADPVGEPLGAREFALALARSLAFVLPAFPFLTVRNNSPHVTALVSVHEALFSQWRRLLDLFGDPFFVHDAALPRCSSRPHS